MLVYDLNNNTLCDPPWESTDCFICWKGFLNGIKEVQFLIYFLDLITIIFIFGTRLTPQKLLRSLTGRSQVSSPHAPVSCCVSSERRCLL